MLLFNSLTCYHLRSLGLRRIFVYSNYYLEPSCKVYPFDFKVPEVQLSGFVLYLWCGT